ncbi:hypothetical protein GYMLUDRAFT_241651 [Collybiopsis luxurians FD-317 M1]|uniref:Uncharacterized protein n=1 Tax=Collybiopsis luxurians FD-317 M1 TaxID=944289 RepID=A0A0D0C6H8_9AGAR|nr:hypothetical protein GYMLUDRAFT_241651 [Collybiopsis luxurians FD-317 M1]
MVKNITVTVLSSVKLVLKSAEQLTMLMWSTVQAIQNVLKGGSGDGQRKTTIPLVKNGGSGSSSARELEVQGQTNGQQEQSQSNNEPNVLARILLSHRTSPPPDPFNHSSPLPSPPPRPSPTLPPPLPPLENNNSNPDLPAVIKPME